MDNFKIKKKWKNIQNILQNDAGETMYWYERSNIN